MIAPRIDVDHLDGLDPGLRRWGLAKRFQERFDPLFRSGQLDPHRVGLVEHPAGQIQMPGRVEYERPETHPLDHAANGYGNSALVGTGLGTHDSLTGRLTGWRCSRPDGTRSEIRLGYSSLDRDIRQSKAISPK